MILKLEKSPEEFLCESGTSNDVYDPNMEQIYEKREWPRNFREESLPFVYPLNNEDENGWQEEQHQQGPLQYVDEYQWPTQDKESLAPAAMPSPEDEIHPSSDFLLSAPMDQFPDDFRINSEQIQNAEKFDNSHGVGDSEAKAVKNKPALPIGQPFKREGQEEFLTFVDPIPPKPGFHKVEPKLSLALPSIQKRIPNSMRRSGADGDRSDALFIVIVMGCATVGILGIAVAGVMFTRLHRRYRAAQEADYPHYGVTGPARERLSPSSPIASMDAKLASSAQLYHYQHTKQQILTMEGSTLEMRGNESDESEGEGDEGDYSVYECPGLAPTGDLEISNPLFENQSPIAKTSSERLQSKGPQESSDD
uniref:Neural proliferation differentiation and control protein 1 n=1 Tax=Romanomermis culicivorax TaxID=13658 RepID=A0A915J4D7_ROMCU